MVEKHSYSYTKLADLKNPNENATNVWAVITFFSSVGTELKMMLVDESETQIFCVLNADRSQNIGNISLSNSMIIRIHRCKICRANNNQITIIGRINYAGLHLAAWCVDDLCNETRFRTSEGFTFDRADNQRLQELRTFWKKRNTDDGMARQLFFEMVKFRPVEECEATIAANVAPCQRRLSSVENASQISFDQFTDNATSSQESIATDNGTDYEQNRLAHCRTAVETKTELLVPDEAFLEELRKETQNIARQSPNKKWTQFSEIKLNAYFDIICQVVAVHVPLGNSSAVYLRVCDGTKVGIEKGPLYSVHSLRDTHTVQSQMFAEEAMSDHFKDFVYIIGCWEDFAQKAAKNFVAGDIVIILNAKTESRNTGVGVVHISLHGHTPKSERYKRDIQLVKRRLENNNNALGEETENRGDGKRARLSEDNVENRA